MRRTSTLISFLAICACLLVAGLPTRAQQRRGRDTIAVRVAIYGTDTIPSITWAFLR
ncbi:hypothetical protein MKQ70_05950 [Chitinophaga sedimenti]|uniref:hypothetical protein n=1 Tax=Chitinophaga sedimenti TaxID=2033606 RepID=UPI002005CB97|nr:hypothetical protein [Chitinophaga sedimenti]MCK7554572.1 hypothetical protein [Chitinophaga sedimenti]